MRKMQGWLFIAAIMLSLVGSGGAKAQDYTLGRMYYYPYYYFPHNYWPQQSPSYPERLGDAYMKPHAYMAYPPFHEPHWRYELNTPMRYYRGFHFWLDQF